MAAGDGKSWKIFGIVVIALVIAGGIAAAAFFIGRGCEGEDEKAKTTTTRTQPADTAPAPADVAPDEPAAAGTDAGADEAPAAPTETTATTERYVTGEAEGSTPCTGGFQTTTRTTYWSDGSTDTVTVTEPCP
ncbi:MAG: hypothetical protein HZB44_03235 [Actinobacteria bacterium]|nr:hypothetical protein [Actinomycetota bacterium]